MDMKEKLEVLFAHKRRLVLASALENMTPLLLLAKVPELRSSIEKVMPEKVTERSHQVDLESNSQHLNENDQQEGQIDDTNEAVSSEMNALALDPRAAKSVIRLSNAILPLLSFYQEHAAPPIKQSSVSPSKAAKKKAHLNNSSNSTVTVTVTGTSSVSVQEVHHAFHAVLRHIHRLESASAGTVDLHAAATATSKPEPPLPPPLVDVMMNVSCS